MCTTGRLQGLSPGLHCGSFPERPGPPGAGLGGAGQGRSQRRVCGGRGGSTCVAPAPPPALSSRRSPLAPGAPRVPGPSLRCRCCRLASLHPPGPRPPAPQALRALPGGGGRDGAGGREAGQGLSSHGRRGITGLRFLREQNNYNFHTGPEFPESKAGSPLRIPSSEAKYLFHWEEKRAGKEKSQLRAGSPVPKGRPHKGGGRPGVRRGPAAPPAGAGLPLPAGAPRPGGMSALGWKGHSGPGCCQDPPPQHRVPAGRQILLERVPLSPRMPGRLQFTTSRPSLNPAGR